MTGRIERLRERLRSLDVGAMLVMGLANVRYVTGFASSNAALLVDAERAVLLTDGRYIEAARSVTGVDVVQVDRDLASELGQRLGALVDGQVAFEADHLTVAQHGKIAASAVLLVPVEKVVESLRAVKEDEEVAVLRRSGWILSEAFALLANERLVGRTEAEIAWWLERTLRDLGADGLAFEPIVAGGPNAALPHHHTGRREIGPGETVVVDAGCVVDGYCSDCTRTFATGPLTDELVRAYAVCQSAQAQALAAILPGAVCSEVDGIARRALEEAGYEVLHGLGHGVGLEIHEEPRLAKTATGTLEAGNVVTVEPGVYLAGLGGIRIEDLVVVGEGGPDVLTPVTKDLLTLA